MWRGKDIIALILSILAICLSLFNFIDHLGSKILALVFFIFSLCLLISIVIDSKKERNKK